jgi:hypothetical protein
MRLERKGNGEKDVQNRQKAGNGVDGGLTFGAPIRQA